MALPDPECGLVISYSYLWRHESAAGQTEGVKDRPCAIVLAMEDKDKDAKRVTVAPITHTPPADPANAVEIPPKVKQHLGLDGKRSWIVLDEFNEFTWPGFDLRPIPGTLSRYDYGFLPPALFAKITGRVLGTAPRRQSGLVVARRKLSDAKSFKPRSALTSLREVSIKGVPFSHSKRP